MKSLAALLLASLTFSVFLNAQEHYNTPKGTQFIQMHSEQTGRDYELLVKLPDSYASSRDKSYAVLYYTDAQWDASLISTAHGKLNYDKILPEVILVGITYPGADANYGALRTKDLTQVAVEGREGSGEAGKFLQFIEDSIIPKVESTYRIDAEKRGLGGVSLGGLFSLYAMYEKPDLFKRFISITPATSWSGGELFERDQQHASAGNSLDVRIFITYGGNERAAHMASISKFQRTLAERDYEGMELLNWVAPGERHGGVAMDGWTRGLRWAFKDLVPVEE